MVVTEPTHIAHWGVFVTTPEVSNTQAKVAISTKVANESKAESVVTVMTTLFDSAGKKLGATQSSLTIAAGQNMEAEQIVAVSNPALWSPERRFSTAPFLK